MAVAVQTIGVIPSVVVAFEFEKLGSSRVSARQTQGEHRGFTAAVGETHRLGGWHHAQETLGGFRLRRSGGRQMRTLIHLLPNPIDTFRVPMGPKHWAQMSPS